MDVQRDKTSSLPISKTALVLFLPYNLKHAVRPSLPTCPPLRLNLHGMSMRRPSKCSVPTLLCDVLQMLTNAGKSGSTLAGECWRGRLDGVAGTLGFPLARRASLMLISMLVAVGVNRTLLQRLLGGKAFALAFR